MINVSALRSLATGVGLYGAVTLAVAGPVLLASAAQAEWVPEGRWRRGVVVVPPPVLVAPPPRVVAVAPPPVIVARPPVVVARPYRRWVRGHTNWRGFWVPGHWR